MREMLLFLLALDLTRATVVAPPTPSPVEAKAAQILVEEVEKRSRVEWTTGPAAAPTITLARATTKLPTDAYSISTAGNNITLSASTPRGLVFAAGRLLRSLRLERDKVTLPEPLNLTSAPKTQLRGHQLGYRPKTNSYDGWSAPMWDAYIRDLAIFGTNAIELIPPRSDDAADSPHFPAPQMRMMIEMSRIAASYGLDVWVWYPALDKDYTTPESVDAAVKEWTAVLNQLPRLDAVFVPGGDPGHTQPKVLFNLLERETAAIRLRHPKAQMWVSPQGFSTEWFDEFYQLLKAEPQWLAGVAHGPQVRVSLRNLRASIPARYPIRDYPDITHSLSCQFAVPDWDLAFSQTAAREPINPRPADMRDIFLDNAKYTAGFITYSEGSNDDLNKFVWSALAWDPDQPIDRILREYARYFIGANFETQLAEAIAGLERNWRGALLANPSVESTLALFQTLERTASPQQLLNWRFQQLLYRAYYDAHTQRRLKAETEIEARALAALRNAQQVGALYAIDAAERALAQTRPTSPLRLRVFSLAEALYQSNRMQLSVPLYKAISRDRGATLDNIDAPLNNRPWLTARFAEIRKLTAEPERLQAIEAIVNYEDPGPGGFYDDLGNPAAQPHLVRSALYSTDPGHLFTPRNGFARHSQPPNEYRKSWLDHAEVMYDGPLEMRYIGLDPKARYRVRIRYGGERNATRIQRLTANGSIEIHPYQTPPDLFTPVEFDIPAAATAQGDLRLTWQRKPGLAGNGRGNQVAEVWLLRLPAKP